MTKVAIWGASRSGSTIFEMFLSKKLGLTALGEVKNYKKRAVERGELCGCGSKVIECIFWSGIYRNYIATKRDVYSLIECETSSYVDSSKSPFYLMRHISRFDKHYLIMRYPSSVINSYQKIKERPESNGKENQYMRRLSKPVALIYWIIFNFVSVIIMPRGVVVDFSYFSACFDNFDLSCDRYHQISGNPSRFGPLKVIKEEVEATALDKLLLYIFWKLVKLKHHDSAIDECFPI